MLVFRKIWRALFSWNSRFQIRTFLSVGDIHFIIIFIFCKKELILALLLVTRYVISIHIIGLLLNPTINVIHLSNT